MILDEKQRMHIRNVRTATLAYQKSKAEALARAKTSALAEVNSYRSAMDHEVRQAFAAGVPKLQIRRDGMGTTDSRTLEESLARSVATAQLAAELERDPLAHKFRLGERPRTVVVTLSGEQLAGAIDKWCDEHDRIVLSALTAPEYAEATIEVAKRPDGSTHLSAVTPNAIKPSYTKHPAVYWVGEAANQRAVLDWYAEQTAGAGSA